MRVLRRTVFVWKRVLAFVGCWDMERGGEALLNLLLFDLFDIVYYKVEGQGEKSHRKK